MALIEVQSATTVNATFSQVNADIATASGTLSTGIDVALVPVGTIIGMTTSGVPDHYLECDGSTILRSVFPELFAVIGVSYGSGDATNFIIPDMQGRFPRGWDHGATRDPDRASRADRGDGTTGDNVGTTQSYMYQQHNHASSTSIRVIWPTNSGNGQCGNVSGRWLSSGGPFDAGGNETRPLNINVMWIIKYE